MPKCSDCNGRKLCLTAPYSGDSMTQPFYSLEGKNWDRLFKDNNPAQITIMACPTCSFDWESEWEHREAYITDRWKDTKDGQLGNGLMALKSLAKTMIHKRDLLASDKRDEVRVLLFEGKIDLQLAFTLHKKEARKYVMDAARDTNRKISEVLSI